MRKKRLNIVVSFLIGLGIFGFFLYKLGAESIRLIFENINFFYLLLFFIVTTLTFFPIALRWQVILKAYRKKVSFLRLLKQTIAGYAVSYITPSVRLGGEPLRAYMLKREANVDLKTGTSSIIIDKFVELAGTTVFGVIGLSLLMLIPGVSASFKFVLFFLIAFTFFILMIFYHRTVIGRGSFSSLFNLFRLYKITKFERFVHVLEDVERKMRRFFKRHKKEFFLSFFFYFLYGLLVVIEMKFLLLSFGISASLIEIILAVTVLGLVNFIPVPAALGFLEAGQSGLFLLLKGAGSIGFALSLLLRIRALIFVAIGFALIYYFSAKEIEKKVSEYRKNI